jgi:hypothetical protein
MMKTIVSEFETILSNQDIQTNNCSADEVKTGLLFSLSVLALMFIGVVLLLKAS